MLPTCEIASLVDLLRKASEETRRQILAELTVDELKLLENEWSYWARPNQRAPDGNWSTWLVLAGRGWGKTRTGAEWCRSRWKAGAQRIALVAATAADARDVMVEGESGLLNIGLPHERPVYEPSKRRLTWPDGAIATTYSADKPDRLRGPQHDSAWCDELASWRYPAAWDMLLMGLRLGSRPQVVATTTPRPIKTIRELIARSSTVVTRGSTYENLSNLAPSFRDTILTRYEGTRLGRQELEAEILEDVECALWKRAPLDECRVDEPPALQRVVVAVDPAVSSKPDSDETGIVVAGLGADGHGYVLADYSKRASPDEWARTVVEAYRLHHADRVIAEVNQGGDLVEKVLRTVDADLSYKKITASRGKVVRAEPIAALYEQGRVHHVGVLAALEDQLCTWVVGDRSPDRLDALVYALTELVLKTAPVPSLSSHTTRSKWTIA